VKFHSSQTVAGQFTVANVMQNEDHHEDTKQISYDLNFVQKYPFLTFYHSKTSVM
jgi:hypothetical protein